MLTKIKRINAVAARKKKPQKIIMLVTVCVEHRRVDYITRLARFLKNNAWCDHSQTKKWCLQQRHHLKSCLNTKKGYHDNIRFWHCDQTCIVDMITETMLYLLTVCRERSNHLSHANNDPMRPQNVRCHACFQQQKVEYMITVNQVPSARSKSQWIILCLPTIMDC